MTSFFFQMKLSDMLLHPAPFPFVSVNIQLVFCSDASNGHFPLTDSCKFANVVNVFGIPIVCKCGVGWGRVWATGVCCSFAMIEWHRRAPTEEQNSLSQREKLNLCLMALKKLTSIKLVNWWPSCAAYEITEKNMK